jgi:hypothetical protein
MCWGRKAASGRSFYWLRIPKSDFFVVRTADLRPAHMIGVSGSIALGFVRCVTPG